MSNPPLLQLQHINKSYQIGREWSTVLHDISLNIYSGELIAIVGASGSGKSTLMNIIGLLDKVDSGDYWLNGRQVASLGGNQLALLRNQSIGFVFQQFNLLPRFNAKQNVALPLHYRRTAPAEIQERVMHTLTHVGMQAYAEYRPTQLSGGQQQRIAIARALVGEPQVILADEPTGALDSRTGSDIMNLFLALHREGRTIIIITHDEQIANQCNRRISLADGRLVSA